MDYDDDLPKITYRGQRHRKHASGRTLHRQPRFGIEERRVPPLPVINDHSSVTMEFSELGNVQNPQGSNLIDKHERLPDLGGEKQPYKDSVNYPRDLNNNNEKSVQVSKSGLCRNGNMSKSSKGATQPREKHQSHMKRKRKKRISVDMMRHKSFAILGELFSVNESSDSDCVVLPSVPATVYKEQNKTINHGVQHYEADDDDDDEEEEDSSDVPIKSNISRLAKRIITDDSDSESFTVKESFDCDSTCSSSVGDTTPLGFDDDDPDDTTRRECSPCREENLSVSDNLKQVICHSRGVVTFRTQGIYDTLSEKLVTDCFVRLTDCIKKTVPSRVKETKERHFLDIFPSEKEANNSVDLDLDFTLRNSKYSDISEAEEEPTEPHLEFTLRSSEYSDISEPEELTEPHCKNNVGIHGECEAGSSKDLSSLPFGEETWLYIDGVPVNKTSMSVINDDTARETFDQCEAVQASSEDLPDLCVSSDKKDDSDVCVTADEMNESDLYVTADEVFELGSDESTSKETNDATLNPVPKHTLSHSGSDTSKCLSPSSENSTVPISNSVFNDDLIYQSKSVPSIQTDSPSQMKSVQSSTISELDIMPSLTYMSTQNDRKPSIESNDSPVMPILTPVWASSRKRKVRCRNTLLKQKEASPSSTSNSRINSSHSPPNVIRRCSLSKERDLYLDQLCNYVKSFCHTPSKVNKCLLPSIQRSMVELCSEEDVMDYNRMFCCLSHICVNFRIPPSITDLVIRNLLLSDKATLRHIHNAHDVLTRMVSDCSSVVELNWSDIESSIKLLLKKDLPSRNYDDSFLDIVVLVLKVDLYGRSVENLSGVRSSKAYRLLSQDVSSSRRKILVGSLQQVVTRIATNSSPHLLKLLNVLHELLELCICISSSSKDTAVSLAVDLRSFYTDMSCLEERRFFLLSITSMLLLFHLAVILLESQFDNTLPLCEFSLEAVVECFFKAVPQIHIPAPPTEQAEDDAPRCPHHYRPSHLQEQVEEIMMLLYLVVKSYLQVSKGKLNLPLRLRSQYLPEEMSLNQTDVQILKTWPEHMTRLQEHIDGLTVDVTERTRQYIILLNVLAE